VQWVGRIFFLLLKGAYRLLTPGEVLQTFLAGFPLDLAFTGYFMVISILMYWLGKSLHYRAARFILLTSGLIFLQISIILSLADAEMFAAWGTKFNRQALQYLNNPKEAVASASEVGLSAIVFLWALSTWLFFIWLRRISLPVSESFQTRKEYMFTAGRAVVSMAFMAVFIRGGFGNVPVNQSAAVFSSKPAANMAAINSGWNFLYFLINKNESIDPEAYHFYLSGDDDAWLNRFYVDTASYSSSISEMNQPNVCIIVLESFSAYASKFLTGANNAMPFLDSLQQTGFSMKRAFASGDRTDKGLAAIIGAWHGQPWQSILHEPDKAAKLSSLASLFNKKGYKTGFIYGGDLGFANMKSYLYAAGFQHIIDQADFDSRELTSKWGAHDEWTLKKLMMMNTDAKKPFFHVLLTLSSHEPYDVPGGPYYKTDSPHKALLNSIAYTDQCIRRFMQLAAKKSWFSNTLFVFVADHGRDLGYAETQFDRSGHFHIPLFFWGPALHRNLQGLVSHHVSSQCDIAETLNQGLLRNKARNFPFSWHLLHRYRNPTATYIFNSGFGVVHNEAEIVFHNQPRQRTFAKGNGKLCDSLLNMGQVFQYSQIKKYLNF
jgi:phosphoglycerol transferase MdoB-like AlkP superfamily enzyme